VKGISGVVRGSAARSGEPAVEGDLEGIEDGLSALRPAFASLSGGVEAHDGHVDALESGRLVRKVSAGADGLSDARVHRLDGVDRAYNSPYSGVELKGGDELGPGVLPPLHKRRILDAPGVAELEELLLGDVLGRVGQRRRA
jgi:hypothetical protein